MASSSASARWRYPTASLRQRPARGAGCSCSRTTPRSCARAARRSRWD